MIKNDLYLPYLKRKKMNRSPVLDKIIQTTLKEKTKFDSWERILSP